MGLHYPAEPDFNAVDDDDAAKSSHRRQLITYTGVILSLVALLVILYLNM